MKKGKESKNDLVVVAVRTCLFQTFFVIHELFGFFITV